MRDYAKVSPQFWIGTTGKAIRASGSDAQIVALYLLTSPHATMLGLYYLPMLYIAHETGRGIEGASEGLKRCMEAAFCSYDEASEMVWVHEMAAYQIAGQLSPNDKRCAGIQNDYDKLPGNAFLKAFFDRYKAAFHLTRPRESVASTRSPKEGTSMPLRSQEQEQEQEHAQDHEGRGAAKARPSRTAPSDFMPDRKFALELIPDIDVDAEFAKFRDCEFPKPHRDWPRVWRAWVRRCKEGHKYSRNATATLAEPPYLPNGTPNPRAW